MGIELETVLPVVGRGETRDVQDLLARLLSTHGVPSVVRSYSQTAVPDGADICVETDSSLRGETRYEGVSWAHIEIKTRPMTFTDLARIMPPALDIVRYVGARVTTSCGFHVHHDLPEVAEQPEIVRNLMHLWWRYHKVIYGLVAPSRQSNVYCRQPKAEDATRFDKCRTYQQVCEKLTHCERQSGLNLTNLTASGRKTVEWRIHQGTIDWTKVKAFVLATARWTEHACQRSCHYRPEPVLNSQAGLNKLLIATGLKPNSRIYPKVDPALRQVGHYLLRRWKHFNTLSEEDADAS